MNRPMRFLRSAFLTGIVLVFPFVVTIFAGKLLFEFADGTLRPVVTRVLGREIPGLGLLTTLLIILLVGILGRSVLGKWLLKLAEQGIHRVPGLRHMYDALKQIAQMLMGGGERSFQRVVLVEFPRRGVKAFGLVTTELELADRRGRKKKYSGVFVPTNHLYLGHFLCVPDAELVHVDMEVADAIKVILSAGSAAPGRLDETGLGRPQRRA